jgi:hypothetical protein
MVTYLREMCGAAMHGMTMRVRLRHGMERQVMVGYVIIMHVKG